MGRLALSALALAIAAALCSGACKAPGKRALIPPTAELRAVVVESVAADVSGTPVLTLAETAGARRRLPIWIAQDQAQSIQIALAEIQIPRPNTHDLLVGILGAVERRIERVAITDLHDDTYYAVIELAGENGGLQLDARPSDAIALAVRTGAKIFVEEHVLAGAAPLEGEGEALDVEWQPSPPAAPPLPADERDHSRSTLRL